MINKKEVIIKKNLLCPTLSIYNPTNGHKKALNI